MRILRARLNGGSLVLPDFADPVFDGTELTIVYDPWPKQDRAWEVRETAARLAQLGKQAAQVLFEARTGHAVTVFLPIFTGVESPEWFRTLKPKTYRSIKNAMAASDEMLIGEHVATIDCSTPPRKDGERVTKPPAQLAVDLVKQVAKAAGYKHCLPLGPKHGADYWWAGPPSLK